MRTVKLRPDSEARSDRSRSGSPVRVSGSPQRRQQILQLESKKRARVEGHTEPVAQTIEAVAAAVERIATTFTATATSLQDTRLTQRAILEELRELRAEVAALRAEVGQRQDKEE